MVPKIQRGENTMKDEAKRTEKYYRLKAVGFNSREANRLKDHSDERVRHYIHLKQKHNREMKAAIINGPEA